MSSGHHQRLDPRSRRPVACHLSPGPSWTRSLLFSSRVGLAGRWCVWAPDPWGPIPWGGTKPGPEARRRGQELACVQSSFGGEDGQTGRAGPTQSLIPTKAIMPAAGEDSAIHTWSPAMSVFSSSSRRHHPWGSQGRGQRLRKESPLEGMAVAAWALQSPLNVGPPTQPSGSWAGHAF